MARRSGYETWAKRAQRSQRRSLRYERRQRGKTLVPTPLGAVPANRPKKQLGAYIGDPSGKSLKGYSKKAVKAALFDVKYVQPVEEFMSKLRPRTPEPPKSPAQAKSEYQEIERQRKQRERRLRKDRKRRQGVPQQPVAEARPAGLRIDPKKKYDPWKMSAYERRKLESQAPVGVKIARFLTGATGTDEPLLKRLGMAAAGASTVATGGGALAARAGVRGAGSVAARLAARGRAAAAVSSTERAADRAGRILSVAGKPKKAAARRLARTAQSRQRAKAAARAVKRRQRPELRKTKTASAAAAAPVGAGSATADEKVRNIASAPYQVARATVEAPGRTLKASAKSLRDTFYGLPAAIVQAATSPKQALDMMVEDVKRRYGPLAEGRMEEFRRRVQEEGFTPELLDALIVAPPASRVAGAAARSGRLGERARRLMVEERPQLRTSAIDVRPQKLSKGIIGAATQRGVDKLRRARQAQRVTSRRKRLIEAKHGEVVPITTRHLKRNVARDKGRAFQAMSEEMPRQVNPVIRGVNKLSRAQREAVSTAIRYGVRTPEQARVWLRKRADEIDAARAEARITGGYSQAKLLRKLADRADEIFTPKLAAVVDEAVATERRLSKGDPALDARQAILRRTVQQAEMLGIRRAEGESVRDYLLRVREAAEKEGLARPGYVASELPRGRRGRAEFAVGGSRGASHIPKRYTGKLHRLGLESDAVEVVVRGIARNVKRRYNWTLVADTFDRATPAWARNKSRLELSREISRRGIDENEVVLFNAKKFRRAIQEQAEAMGVAPNSAELLDSPALHRAIEQSVEIGAGMDPRMFDSTNGWSLVPKQVFDELNSQITASGGLVGRLMDIGTQKSARLILALNFPWLGLQVAGNFGLAATGAVNPITMIRATRWWKGLSDAERAAIGPYIGIGHFASDIRQTKLGSTADNLPTGPRQIYEAWSGFKEILMMKAGGRSLNPLDLLFRADNAQNNAFRRAMLYKEANRVRWERMRETSGRLVTLQDRLSTILRRAPDEQITALMRDPKLLERYAKEVNDLLGDYATYTGKERAFLKRNLMFYGWMRFSLRYAFYTLPTRHPMMTGILGNLARLKTEEVKDLLGGADLPFALGQLYFDVGNKKMVVDLARANPLMNAVSEAETFRTLAGVLPPYWHWLISQVAAEDTFTGRDWRVKGESQPRRFLDYSLDERARILAADVLSMFYPYRTAMEMATKGAAQGDDSLIFDQRPINYKPGGEADRRNQEKIRKAEQRDPLAYWLDALLTIQPAENVTRPAQFIYKSREEERARIEGGRRYGVGVVVGGESGGSGSSRRVGVGVVVR